MVSQETLKSILEYDLQTGIFRWKIRCYRRLNLNQIAGWTHYDGYNYIKIKGKQYASHRLAWMYVYGEWPMNHIDHIDGNRANNGISNLRDVNNRQNISNQKKHRDGKLVGTTFNKQANKWQAQIRINGKSVYLGLFNTETEAHEAYNAAIPKLKEVV